MAADLSITKSQVAPLAGNPVSQGEMIAYQITVANTGSTAAATVTDTLPLGETLISASDSTGVSLPLSGNTITDNLGSLGSSPVTITIDALVNGQATGTLTNTASVSSPDENGGLPIVSAPVSTIINNLTATAPSLSITKTAANNNSVVSSGGAETYTLTVTNNSTNAAQNVTVLDQLPAGSTFVSGTVTGGTGQTILSAPTANLDTINLGTLAANGSATITMSVTAPSAVGAMVNQASVVSTSGNATLGNASASVATAVQGTTAPNGTVDLAVTKSLASGTNATLPLGSNASYVVTVTNNGTADATGVVVSDVLPVGSQLISGSTGVAGVNVTNNNGIATATLPTLAAGASATLTLTLSAPLAGALTDSVYVEGNQPDANQANNVATATSLINGAATPAVDLSVTKTASATTGSIGTNVTYTITVTNNSTNNTATGVVATEVLPANASFVSATSAAGSLLPINGVLTDRIGSLAAGASDTITVTVKPTAVGVITDQAFVAGDQLDPTLTNNIASLTTPVQGTTAADVNLSVTKTAANNNANVALGANETYTLTVTNNGNANATGVVVSDVLPATVGFVSGTTSVNGVTVADVNGTVTANLGTLNAGQTATVTVTVTPGALGAITDTAYAEANEVDASQTNNSASVTTNVVSPSTLADLSIIKVAAPSPATVGQPLTYTLIVTNTGAAAADNVVVTDTLPGSTTFVSATSNVNNVTPANSNGTVTANLGTVASGAIDVVTIIVTPTATGTANNSASLTTSTDNTSTHTTASTSTTINASTSTQANLSITKIASPSPDTVGQPLTYTLLVTNTGADAADVVVTDTLPSGVTFGSATTNVTGVTPTTSGSTVTANLGAVAAGAVDTVTIVVTPTATGTLNNTAKVTTSSTNVSTQTTASTSTTINPSTSAQANLSIIKTASPSPDIVGQNLTYSLVVTNTGNAAADNVVVSDALPAGVTFVSAATNVTNVTPTNSSGTVTLNLGTVAAGTVDTVTIIVTPNQAGTISNTATVTTTSANASTHTTSTVPTTINAASAAANLSITKTASPSPGIVGQDLTYTIVVSDAAGAADAAGVAVTDTLPAGATFVSAIDINSGNSLTPSSNLLTDNIGTVAAGTSDTIVVTVTPTSTGTLTNTASLTTSTSNISNQTSATVSTTISEVNAAANLSITKTASPSPGTVGQNLTYTIVVTNAAGAAAANNVFIIDTLPVGLANLVSATDTTRGATLTATGAAIKDVIGTLAAGSSDTMVVVASPTKTGQITNTATVHTTSPNASNDTTAVVKTQVNAAGPTGPSCYLNGQAGDGTDQTFLTNLYHEVLDRNPDQTGFQYWLNYLQTNGGTTATGQSNAATRQQVVQTFLHSQEYETNWVDCVFDNFLNRHADEDAIKFFVNQLNNGATEQDVLIAVLTSGEYFGHPGPHGRGAAPGHGPADGNSNQAFVDNLYAELLGRPADTTGEQVLVNALNSGQLTRAQVVMTVLDSPEEAHDLMIANGAGAVGAAGSPATGSYPLAVLTGDGWNDLYFQGNLQSLNSGAVDQFMSALEAGTSWQTVQQQMLTLPEYFNG